MLDAIGFVILVWIFAWMGCIAAAAFFAIAWMLGKAFSHMARPRAVRVKR